MTFHHFLRHFILLQLAPFCANRRLQFQEHQVAIDINRSIVNAIHASDDVFGIADTREVMHTNGSTFSDTADMLEKDDVSGISDTQDVISLELDDVPGIADKQKAPAMQKDGSTFSDSTHTLEKDDVFGIADTHELIHTSGSTLLELDIVSGLADQQKKPRLMLKKQLTQNVVMIGNPGTGKSTLLNGIIGKVAFNSGVSWGTGMTYQLDMRTVKGVRYMDTPGLSDVAMRKKAAVAIKEAMRQGGEFQLFFVVTLQAGRISPEDKTTIKLVIDAVPDVKANNYSIIINKIPPKTLTKMKDRNGLGEKKVRTQLMHELPRQTQHFYFNEYRRELDDVDNAKWEIHKDLASFIRSAPKAIVNPANVKDIKENEFEQIKEDLERQLTELRQNAKKQEEAMRASERRHSQAMREQHRQSQQTIREISRNAQPQRRKRWCIGLCVG